MKFNCEKLKRFVFDWLAKELPVELAYHGLHHTREQVLPAVDRISREMGVSREEHWLIVTAALFHDAGYIKQYRENEGLGAELAASILPEFHYSSQDIAFIKRLILATAMPQRPQSEAENILCDADMVSLGTAEFFETSMMLRREKESFQGPVSLQSWLEEQYQFLQAHHYFTTAARTFFDEQKNRNIMELQAIVESFRGRGSNSQELVADHRDYQAVQALLGETHSWSLGRLRTFYQQRDFQLWQLHPDLFLLAGNIVLKQGEPLLAYDIFSTGISVIDPDLRLGSKVNKQNDVAIQLTRNQARALAQSGAPSSAETLLTRLVKQGISDSETMGLLGRVYKDMAFSRPERQKQYQSEAYTIYFQAYCLAVKGEDKAGAYYNGINAATLAFLSDNKEQAVKLAREVEQLCLSIRRDGDKDANSFWLDATLGESALLQGDFDRSKEYYRQACQKAGHDFTGLSSISKQVRLIMAHGTMQNDLKFSTICRLPSVIVFSGHMIDTGKRKEARFSLLKQPDIRDKIRFEVQRLRGGIGYSAAAAGSDILFLEAMLASGGEINIVLPVAIQDFKEQSVLPAGSDWEERFENILAKADSLTILDEFKSNNFENSLEFTNMYLFGIARLRAEQMGIKLHPLAVLQKHDTGGRGGTAAMVRLWQEQQVEHTLISLKQAGSKPHSEALSIAPVAPSCSCYDTVTHHTCLPMLFADVKGYSQWSEDEAICFSGSFLGRVARILKRHQEGILSKRTVGDGLFLVFHDLENAIIVARSLQEMIKTHDWQEDGLPANLQMRISLDAGPCYSYTDPVMDKREFCGRYVVRAARMEPITPPGHIYASDTFVALCRAAGLGQGTFSYAGQVILPKSYGTLAVYHVNPDVFISFNKGQVNDIGEE